MVLGRGVGEVGWCGVIFLRNTWRSSMVQSERPREESGGQMQKGRFVWKCDILRAPVLICATAGGQFFDCFPCDFTDRID